MPRIYSSDWSVDDDISAARLHDFNQEIDDIFAYGSDRGRIRMAISGTALRIDIGAFAWRVGSTSGQYAGGTDITVVNAATNYVEIDAAGDIQINQSGWTTANGRLGTVTCAGGVVTAISIWKTDVVGGILGASTLVNSETLSGNKTLEATDKYFQKLNPNGANRDVTLDTATQSEGASFWIKNTGTAYNLLVKQSSTIIGIVKPGYIMYFVYDGTNWNAFTKMDMDKYGDGSDGAKHVTSSEDLNPATIFKYSSLVIDASQTVSVTSVNTPLHIKVMGDVVINGMLDLNGKGGAGNASPGNGVSSGSGGSGGAGTAGNSTVSGWTVGAGPGGSGGDTTNGDPGKGSGGGGGGSLFTDGGTAANGSKADTSGGARLLDKYLTMLTHFELCAACGGGGGAGGGGGKCSGCNNGCNGNVGGAGAGALLMYVGGNLTLGAAATLRANGVAGTAAVSCTGLGGGGGGGGGGGTMVIIVRGTVTDGGATKTCAGGSGGSSPNGHAGATGAAGNIFIYSIASGTLTVI